MRPCIRDRLELARIFLSQRSRRRKEADEGRSGEGPPPYVGCYSLSPFHARRETSDLVARVLPGIWFMCWIVVLGTTGCAGHSIRSKPACCDDVNRPTAAANDPARKGLDAYTSTKWLPPEQRTKALPARMNATNQDAEAVATLRGRPVAISFIYTRCTNPNKCARVTRTMSLLQSALEETGLASKVRLVLFTYDSEYDNPAVLRAYGQHFGLKFSTNMMMLRLGPKEKRNLFDEFQVAVNFNKGGVNIHGIQLFLFDQRGRWVRTYHSLIWDNAKVMQDLHLLASEEPPKVETERRKTH